MSEQSVIVWDLETVPDLAAAARMLDMGNAFETEVREALGPGFPAAFTLSLSDIPSLSMSFAKWCW
jgi:hypothetical protein